MPCPTCFETMQGLGDSSFWCPTCGTVARQTPAGKLEDIEPPRLTKYALAHDAEQFDRKVKEILHRWQAESPAGLRAEPCVTVGRGTRRKGF